MISWFRKDEEAPFDDDQFQIGLEMGVLAGETRIKNFIAQLEGMDWLLDAIDALDDEAIDDE
jgi:hypothetical protein